MSPDASVMLSGFVGAALATAAVGAADYFRFPWWSLLPAAFAPVTIGLAVQVFRGWYSHRVEVRARQVVELRRVAELRGGGR